MNPNLIDSFADQLGVDPDTLTERWEGRPDHIAEDIFRIQDLDTGEIRDLKLFEPQRKALMAYFFGNAEKINAYKGRRIGFSFVFSLAYALEGLMTGGYHYGFVARKFDQAKERVEDVSSLFKNAKIEIPVDVDNKDELVLWNGSSYKAFTADSDGARGLKSAKSVMLDEMAFMEDQVGVSRAFGAFLSLGTGRKQIQISTPNLSNDKFTETHERGTPTGFDEKGNRIGVISIKQPSFYNADEIDIHTSLHDQIVKPVRPDMNIYTIEEERASDPEGFGQEYLCRPILDVYRFFSAPSIDEAIKRGDAPGYGRGTSATKGEFRVIGVDIGIDHDDTVAVIMDHQGDHRFMRHLDVIDNQLLSSFGIPNPDRGNAQHVAQYLAWLSEAADADLLVLDKTGPGETFARQIEASCGRAVLPFNFSDLKKVNEMMGDTNNALRNGRITLLPNERLEDQMKAIVKQKRAASRPKFSGKDHAKDGKDDMAMATVLAAFPPGYSVKPSTEAAQRSPERRVPRQEIEIQPQQINADGSLAESEVVPPPGGTTAYRRPGQAPGFGAATVQRRHNRRTDPRYSCRHSR